MNTTIYEQIAAAAVGGSPWALLLILLAILYASGCCKQRSLNLAVQAELSDPDDDGENTTA